MKNDGNEKIHFGEFIFDIFRDCPLNNEYTPYDLHLNWNNFISNGTNYCDAFERTVNSSFVCVQIEKFTISMTHTEKKWLGFYRFS